MVTVDEHLAGVVELDGLTAEEDEAEGIVRVVAVGVVAVTEGVVTAAGEGEVVTGGARVVMGATDCSRSSSCGLVNRSQADHIRNKEIALALPVKEQGGLSKYIIFHTGGGRILLL